MKLHFAVWDYGYAIGYAARRGPFRQGVRIRRRRGRYARRPTPNVGTKAEARRVLQLWARSTTTSRNRLTIIRRRRP